LKGNKNYLVIVAVFMMTYGNYIAFGNLVSILFTPFGLTSTQIAIMSILMLSTGIFTAIIFGAWLDKTHQFKSSMVIIAFLSGLMSFFLCFYGVPRAENFAMLSTLSLGCGLVILPIIPTCMTFSIEVTFPMQPAAVTGILMLFGQFSAFSISIICSTVLDFD
jgi:MFS family permease